MKLSRSKSPKRPVTSAGLFRRLVRTVVIALIGLFVIAAIMVLLNPAGLQRGVAALEQRWGPALYSFDRQLADKFSIFIGDLLRDAGEDELEIPQLVIDVPFKGMQKIFEKREDALRRGNLIQGEDDFVKGEIRSEGRTIPVKLRLKGDWNDHLAGRKWSFRVHVRGGDHLYGMRRFSIQSPVTRDYQAEMLFFETARRYDVMTPRYSFVDVTLNGDSMGVMALEESFSKELVENSRRREGVIVRFDESLPWAAADSPRPGDAGWDGAFDHYSNAAIDAFGSGSIAESPVLSKQYGVAVGLLRGFVEQQLTAAEVFDAEQMGRFVAIADVFGSWHAVAWHNMRFYLNPITLKLEPIAYDGNLHKWLAADQSVLNDDPIMQQIIRDPDVFSVYQQTLRELSEAVSSGELIKALRETEERPLAILKTEFRFLSVFPLDHLGPRTEMLLARYGSADTAPENFLFQLTPVEQRLYPLLARVSTLGGTETIEMTNVIPREVEVMGLEWVNSETEERLTTEVAGLPFVMPARGIGSAPQHWLFDAGAAPSEGAWILEATVRLQNRPWGRRIAAVASYAPLGEEPIPQGSVAAVTEQHEFLQLDEAARSAVIPAGSHEINTSIILPKGYSLTVKAGATLQFASDAVLIVHGALQVEGRAEEPVVFEGVDAGRWPGLVVLNAPVRSQVDYLTVRDTSSVVMDNWTLTGGVNFYASDVTILNSRFEDSHGEDALNIIHSEFEIVDSVMHGTASDAFDSDFSTGSVVGSEFIDVGRAGGGDAVDVSGSEISVRDSRFTDVSDKALSVGEQSQMTAENIDMQTVGTGAAAKDASTLSLSNARINGASFAGLTAYVKKPEYGPARIEANDVTMTNTETAALAQTGSAVVIDGSAVETRDVNVDALYDTVMRKGLK